MIERGTDVFPSADFEKFLKKLPYLNGTLVDAFLAEAKKLTIYLSMYFGGSLVGNDCKALFKPGNLASLAVFALDLIAPVAIRTEDRTMIHQSVFTDRVAVCLVKPLTCSTLKCHRPLRRALFQIAVEDR